MAISERGKRIMERAADRRIPDDGLKRVEFIMRILLEHPDGAIPAHFLAAPGGYEFSARICDLESHGFVITRTDVSGKSYKRYTLVLPPEHGQLDLQL